MWWSFFRWMLEATPEELVGESDPLGRLEPLERVADLGGGKEVWRYSFPDQEFDLGRNEVYDPGKAVANPNQSPFKFWKAGEVVETNLVAGTVDLKRLTSDPHPRALVPLGLYRTVDQQASLVELAEYVADHGISGDGRYQAARDLLRNVPPRIGQSAGGQLARPGERDLDAAIRAGRLLDRTTLPIQGPPGSGKTFAGARMILALLADGKRVGITAMSHKVIGNMIRAVQKAAADPTAPGYGTVDLRIVQRGDAEQVLDDDLVTRAKSSDDVRARLDDGRANLAAGTSWLWASSKMAGAVDVLFVDEAGQISLTTVVAVARSTDSLVLLGDPQQLDQPLQGTHPPGTERSALAHILDGRATMPPDLGLFLESTWRLHPDLCLFTSEVFYDDRLAPEPHLERQRAIDPGGLADGTGPRLLERRTTGADNESVEEAGAVAALARRLVEGPATWIDPAGRESAIGWDDVLIVAPYNAQVGAIQRLLPPNARVGTVDKFQGQEAPISIYSMTTSNPELAPRGMDFLYSRHRLNVATSRARCVAVVALSPDLLRVRARNPEQMRLANALCRFAEIAGRGPGAPERLPDRGLAPSRPDADGERDPEPTGPLTLGL